MQPNVQWTFPQGAKMKQMFNDKTVKLNYKLYCYLEFYQVDLQAHPKSYRAIHWVNPVDRKVHQAKRLARSHPTFLKFTINW